MYAALVQSKRIGIFGSLDDAVMDLNAVSSSAVELDERTSEADMEMCTSPTSSVSLSPSLLVGVPDVLPNVTLAASVVLSGTPWSESVGSAAGTMQADPSLAGYMMFGHFGYIPSESHSGENYLSLVAQMNARPKETIRLQNAVLYPPNPNASLPLVRERPLGCRTVFVGGLPEKCTEEIVRELMECCGEIQSVRMSKKNFAHVRFVNYESVDRALSFAGYRMKIEDRSDKAYTGRIHVDYAHARDDMHEWELERHRSQSASPCASSHFNEPEAAALLEKLKDVETFTEASQLLLTWLDKGDCSKKTSTVFYGMIAAVNAHVRRLLHDRRQYEEELRQFRDKQNQRMQELMTQFRQIEKVFRLARKQKNWDHFSRAQRKNVDAWLKHAELMRKASEEAMLRDRQEEEMETSDDDDHASAGGRSIEQGDVQPHKKMRLDSADDTTRHRHSESSCDANTQLQAQLNEVQRNVVQSGFSENCQPNAATFRTSDSSATKAATTDSPEMESRYVALLSCFLNVHPFGASVDYMWAYLRQIIDTVRIADIENTLERYPHLFRLQTTGIGATYERKWFFIGFQK